MTNLELEQKLSLANEKLSNHEDISGAYKLYNECLKVDNNNINALCNIGYILIIMNEPEKALEILFRAHTIAPNDIPTLTNIGDTYIDLKDYNKGVFYLKKAAELNELNEGTDIIYNDLGWAFHMSGKYFEALESYNIAIEHLESDELAATTYSNRGALKVNFLNDLESGIEDLKKAFSLGDFDAKNQLDKLGLFYS